jgi:hypothetical protein
MTSLRATTLVLGVSLLAGCAASVGSGRWVFEKPGVTEAELKRDRGECFSLSIDPDVDRTTTGIVDLGFIRLDRESYKACMEARGYVLRTDVR